MRNVVRAHRHAGIIAAAAAVIAVLAVPAAFAKSSGQPPYVIGVPTELTGPFAYIGNGQLQGLTAYINYVNSQGGVNGRKIGIVPIDDQANPANTVADLKQLVEQNHKRRW